jgi:hypothetical protein
MVVEFSLAKIGQTIYIINAPDGLEERESPPYGLTKPQTKKHMHKFTVQVVSTTHFPSAPKCEPQHGRKKLFTASSFQNNDTIVIFYYCAVCCTVVPFAGGRANHNNNNQRNGRSSGCCYHTGPGSKNAKQTDDDDGYHDAFFASFASSSLLSAARVQRRTKKKLLLCLCTVFSEIQGNLLRRSCGDPTAPWTAPESSHLVRGYECKALLLCMCVSRTYKDACAGRVRSGWQQAGVVASTWHRTVMSLQTATTTSSRIAPFFLDFPTL